MGKHLIGFRWSSWDNWHFKFENETLMDLNLKSRIYHNLTKTFEVIKLSARCKLH